ncbi:threonine--tRNA ligase [Mycoplasma phocimorsus]|uniref:threonine--tRNA ligase n=1 Tax=Mycoplasma phocimorsus TaxID=3045839 RepID=UPI0024BFC0EF|nr:threonine--tRNA ligase [Mycoplasma phocimorsus]MDJ1646372.1 threonine--tRNA ligase [Mycoplasma phocimorsus]
MKVNKNLNHTTAHLMAAAVYELFPDTQLAFGPAIEEGYYYDFKFANPLLLEDLINIEKRMKQLSKRNIHMIEVDEKTYFEFYSKRNADQPFKKYMQEKLATEEKNITYYSLFDEQKKEHVFVDLCAGGHVESVSQIKYFKVLNLSGSYWLGDSNNEQLTRIYGTCWESDSELKEYLDLVKMRKENDHRQLNKQLKLFSFHKLGGQGLPFWLENGMKVRNSLRNLVLKLDKKYGFTEVLTPHFGSEDLYRTSGHLDHYKDDMFPVIEAEGERMIPRPMTCPHHLVLFNSEFHSYRDLPKRYSEQARLYRYEKSGALTGLERVRGMDLTEGHLLVTPEQIEQEVFAMYSQITEMLSKFDLKIDYISLSLRDKEDKEKYFQDDLMWESSEKMLKNVLSKMNVVYEEKIGEAAFYGPKIDIQIKTMLNHEITVSTIQLDFLLPKRFDCWYINKDNEKQTPVMIHRGLIGTYERFISILLEQYKGNFPLWLAPNKIKIIPVALDDKLVEYCKQIQKEFAFNELDAEIDLKDERLPKKIREAHFEKYKYQLIIGENELQNNEISVREFGSNETKLYKLDDFILLVKNKISKYE